MERFSCVVRLIDPTPRAIQHFHLLGAAEKTGQPFSINNINVDYYSITAEDFTKFTFLPYGLSDQDAALRFYLPKDRTHVSCSAVNLQKTQEYFTAQCFRLSSIMRQQGDASIDIIKDIVKTNLLPRLLLIEFDEAHTPLDNLASTRIREHVDALVQAGMRCIAVEGCNATFTRVH